MSHAPARQATKLARAMVTKYGFSEALGKVSLDYEDMGLQLSSETRTQVEHEVRSGASSSSQQLAAAPGLPQAPCMPGVGPQRLYTAIRTVRRTIMGPS